jgi:hypothetical protein
MIDRSKCHLPASGFTFTIKEAHDWARMVTGAASRRLSGPVSEHIWAYRHDDTQILSCNLSDATDACFPISLSETGTHYFHVSEQEAEATVCDMVEATHLAGIIVRAVNASISLGLFANEVNPEVLAQPLIADQTNGHMALATPVQKAT